MTTAPRRHRAGHFLRDATWLLRDSVRHSRSRVVAVVVLHLAAQVLLATALGTAVAYVGKLQNGKPLTLLGLEWTPRESIGLLALVASGVALMLGVSALVSLWSKTVVVKLVRTYEEQCGERALRIFSTSVPVGRSPEARPAEGSALTERTMTRLLTKDIRYCGRALNDLLLATAPSVTGLLAFGVLLYVDWRPTLLVFLVLFLALPLYLRVNRSAAGSMRDIERYARGDAVLKSAAIHRLNRSQILPSTEDSWLDRVIQDPLSRQYLDSYEVRLKSAHRSIFVGNLQLAVLVSFVLVYYGLSVVGGYASAIHILLYLVALQYFLSSLRTVGKHVTNLTIFRVSFGRFRQFMTQSEEGQRIQEAGPSAPRPLAPHEGSVTILPGEPLDGSLERVELQPGRPLSVIARLELSRLTLWRIVSRVFGGDRSQADTVLRGAAFVTPDYPRIPASFEESLGLDQLSRDDHVLLAAQDSTRRELENLLLASRRPVSQQAWWRVSPSLRFLVACLHALRSGPSWLFLDQKAYRQLDPLARSALLDRLGDRFVLLVYGHVPDRMPDCMGEFFVALGTNSVSFIGRRSEYLSHRARLCRELPPERPDAVATEPLDESFLL